MVGPGEETRKEIYVEKNIDGERERLFLLMMMGRNTDPCYTCTYTPLYTPTQSGNCTTAEHGAIQRILIFPTFAKLPEKYQNYIWMEQLFKTLL